MGNLMIGDYYPPMLGWIQRIYSGDELCWPVENDPTGYRATIMLCMMVGQPDQSFGDGLWSSACSEPILEGWTPGNDWETVAVYHGHRPYMDNKDITITGQCKLEANGYISTRAIIKTKGLPEIIQNHYNQEKWEGKAYQILATIDDGELMENYLLPGSVAEANPKTVTVGYAIYWRDPDYKDYFGRTKELTIYDGVPQSGIIDSVDWLDGPRDILYEYDGSKLRVWSTDGPRYVFRGSSGAVDYSKYCTWPAILDKEYFEASFEALPKNPVEAITVLLYRGNEYTPEEETVVLANEVKANGIIELWKDEGYPFHVIVELRDDNTVVFRESINDTGIPNDDIRFVTTLSDVPDADGDYYFLVAPPSNTVGFWIQPIYPTRHFVLYDNPSSGKKLLEDDIPAVTFTGGDCELEYYGGKNWVKYQDKTLYSVNYKGELEFVSANPVVFKRYGEWTYNYVSDIVQYAYTGLKRDVTVRVFKKTGPAYYNTEKIYEATKTFDTNYEDGVVYGDDKYVQLVNRDGAVYLTLKDKYTILDVNNGINDGATTYDNKGVKLLFKDMYLGGWYNQFIEFVIEPPVVTWQEYIDEHPDKHVRFSVSDNIGGEPYVTEWIDYMPSDYAQGYTAYRGGTYNGQRCGFNHQWRRISDSAFSLRIILYPVDTDEHDVILLEKTIVVTTEALRNAVVGSTYIDVPVYLEY